MSKMDLKQFLVFCGVLLLSFIIGCVMTINKEPVLFVKFEIASIFIDPIAGFLIGSVTVIATFLCTWAIVKLDTMGNGPY